MELIWVRQTVFRVGSLLTAALAAVLALWALMSVLSGPLVAAPTVTTIYVDGANGLGGVGCGIAPGALACKTIQEALDGAADGDTISVTVGTYTESVWIDRDVTLQGGWDASFSVWDPAANETIVLGETGTNIDAVTVSTGTIVLLDGLTVAQGDDGVHLHAQAGARLTHLKVHGSDDEGIESNGAWLVVSNTVVFAVGDNGILVEVGSAEIYSATVRHTGQVVTFKSRRGIYLRGAGPDVVSGTLVYNTPDDGIRTRAAADVSLLNNRIYASAGDGIQIDTVATAWAKGNTVYDVANEGIQIAGSGAVTVENNVVYRTGADGILAENALGTALIRGNTVYSSTGKNEDGIQVDRDVVATVQDNTIHDVSDDAIDFKGVSGVVENNTVYDIYAVGIQVENASEIWIRGNAITHTITDTANAIFVGAGVSATIDANTVYSVAADGINFQGSTGVIRYNEIHQTGDQGINVNADDATVMYNTIYDTYGEGVRVRGGSTALLQENTVYSTLGAAVDGIRVEPNTTVTILANTVYSATDDGITFNGATGIISENDVHDNAASGIDVDSDSVTISANRLFGNGGFGLELERVADFSAYSNLVGENGAGGVLAMGVTTGTLVNNTLVGQPAGQIGVGLDVLSPTVTLTSANNIIVSFTTGISVAFGATVLTDYDDVWSNDLDYNGISAGSHSIQQDPLMHGASARDYHLRFGSPCIDAGWVLVAPPFDYEGHERINNPDIGADELKGLSLVKTAPASVEPGALITYTLMITNHLEVTVTNVWITDVVPPDATWIDAQAEGTLWLGTLVSWTVSQIAPDGGTAQVGFVVTASHTITNDRYRVARTDQGVNTRSSPPVVTVVFKGRLFLPLVSKNYAP